MNIVSCLRQVRALKNVQARLQSDILRKSAQGPIVGLELFDFSGRPVDQVFAEINVL